MAVELYGMILRLRGPLSASLFRSPRRPETGPRWTRSGCRGHSPAPVPGHRDAGPWHFAARDGPPVALIAQGRCRAAAASAPVRFHRPCRTV